MLSLLPAQRGHVSIKHTPLFVLPIILLGSIESLGLTLFNYDLLVFQGFLAGYRALFTG
jgi:hypothetical protein